MRGCTDHSSCTIRQHTGQPCENHARHSALLSLSPRQGYRCMLQRWTLGNQVVGTLPSNLLC